MPSLPSKWRTLVVWLAAGSALTTTAQEQLVEEVLVVGSHIPRLDYISPSPVMTVDRESIALDATTTLAEFLNRYPQLQPEWGAFSNNPGNGTSALNLRGLGAERTLVLLNSQRLGPAGADGVVDINTLPPSLIERVEILSGGASATYGSDAIAGAINMHTRRDYTGFEVSATYRITEQSDAQNADISLLGGLKFADDRGHFSAFASFTDRQPLDATDRDFSAQNLVNSFSDGSLNPANSRVIPQTRLEGQFLIDDMIAAEGVMFTPDGNLQAFSNEDGVNFQEFTYLQTQLERTSLGAFLQFEVSEHAVLHLDVLYTNRQSDKALAPAPTSGSNELVNLDNPAFTDQTREFLSANFPVDSNGLVSLPIAWRAVPLGPRASEWERENWRIDTGVRGRLGEQWQYRANLVASREDTEESLINAVRSDAFRQGLLVDPATGECIDPSGGCIPANIFGEGNLSAEAVDYLRFDGLTNTSDTDQTLVSFLVNGPVSAWGGKQIDLAFGAEWRRDESSFDADPRLASAEPIGFGAQANIGGAIEVWELYGEALVPLLENRSAAQLLQLELGYRYSDYTTIGGTNTYKAGLIWQPVDTLRLRAMYQRAVRAPNIGDLYTAQTQDFINIAFLGVEDSCSAQRDPVGNGLAPVCVSQGIPADIVGTWTAFPFTTVAITSGGEQDLESEKADTYTAGFTWQPEVLDGLSLAVDYYRIDLNDAIGSIDPFLLNVLCDNNPSPDSSFCQSIERGDDYNINNFVLKLQNFGAAGAEGIDVQMDYQHSLGTLGRWSSDIGLNFVWNHNLAQESQVNSFDPLYDCAGFYGGVCTATNPENRVFATLRWQWGQVMTALNWQYIDSMRNGAELFFREPFLQPFSVESFHYFDLNLRWSPTEALGLYFGIANLTDEDPPIAGGLASSQNNTVPEQYDVLGRRYQMSLVYGF